MQASVKLQLRLPEDVKKWLEEDARRNSRSMNGQVVAVLRDRMKTQAIADQLAAQGTENQSIPPGQF